MKARVSPVQSIEPRRTLAPTRDLNQELPGPQSRVVTTSDISVNWNGIGTEIILNQLTGTGT